MCVGWLQGSTQRRPQVGIIELADVLGDDHLCLALAAEETYLAQRLRGKHADAFTCERGTRRGGGGATTRKDSSFFERESAALQPSELPSGMPHNVCRYIEQCGRKRHHLLGVLAAVVWPGDAAGRVTCK